MPYDSKSINYPKLLILNFIYIYIYIYTRMPDNALLAIFTFGKYAFTIYKLDRVYLQPNLKKFSFNPLRVN